MLIKFSLIALIFLTVPLIIFAVDGVEINTATLQQLDGITGVGPAIGQRIIDARPFSSIDDLLRVKGIGEKILQNGANALQSIPFIGGVFTGNNLEAVFITSVNNLIISQISGTVNGYFQQIEDEIKIKTSSSSDN